MHAEDLRRNGAAAESSRVLPEEKNLAVLAAQKTSSFYFQKITHFVTQK